MAAETQGSPTQNSTGQHTSSGVMRTAARDVNPFQTFLTKFTNDWSMNLASWASSLSSLPSLLGRASSCSWKDVSILSKRGVRPPHSCAGIQAALPVAEKNYSIVEYSTKG